MVKKPVSPSGVNRGFVTGCLVTVNNWGVKVGILANRDDPWQSHYCIDWLVKHKDAALVIEVDRGMALVLVTGRPTLGWTMLSHMEKCH